MCAEAAKEFFHVFCSRIKHPQHPVTTSHYFNKFFSRLDKMHVDDLRGVTAIAGGSMLHHLVVNSVALGHNQEQRMQALNADMKEFQSRMRTEHTMPPLRLENLSLDGWWMLSGRLIKAANTRSLKPWLEDIANRFFAGHGELQSSTRKVFKHMMILERIFYSAGTFLTDEQHAELTASLLALGRHWQLLRSLYRRQGINAWQIRPKVHYHQHFAQQAKLINPRAVQCYAQESLIGRMAKLWRMNANGPYSPLVQETTLLRYWVALEVLVSTY